MRKAKLIMAGSETLTGSKISGRAVDQDIQYKYKK
jgi:hypothetical protein